MGAKQGFGARKLGRREGCDGGEQLAAERPVGRADRVSAGLLVRVQRGRNRLRLIEPQAGELQDLLDSARCLLAKRLKGVGQQVAGV